MAIKKMIADKVGSSKAGRKLIDKNLGEEGTALVETFIQIATAHTSKEDGEKLKKYIYKIGSKLKSLGDENKITTSEIEDLSTPLISLMTGLTKRSFDVDDLVDDARSLHKMLDKLLEPHITGRSLDRTEFLFEYIENGEVFRKLAEDPSYGQLRTRLTEQLGDILGTEQFQAMAAAACDAKHIIASLDAKYSAIIPVVQDFWRENVMGMEVELAPKVMKHVDTAELQTRGVEVMQMYTKVMRGVGNMQNLIKPIAVEIKQLGIPNEAYDKIHAALCLVFTDFFGKKFGKRTRTCYGRIFDVLAEVLKSLARSVDEGE